MFAGLFENVSLCNAILDNFFIETVFVKTSLVFGCNIKKRFQQNGFI